MPKKLPPRGRKAVPKGKMEKPFEVNCETPIEDNVFYAKDLVNCFTSRIKVDGKLNNLQAGKVVVAAKGPKIEIKSDAPLSKRYVKYLTKKFLRKNELRDFLHVVASSKNGYALKYFNIQNDEADDAE